ncbi:hypothetical protein MRX96_050056 [Rhipicephalus microplus]
MRVMREQSQLQYKQESERWQLALDSLAARLEAHIVNSKNEREVLLDKLAEERRLRGALLEQVGALQRALDIIDADKTSSHENTSATRRVEVTKSAEDVSDVRNAVKAAAVDAGREIVQSQNKPNSDQELLGGDDRNAVKAAAVDAGRVIDQSQNKPNSDQELVGGSPAEAVGWQVKRSKRAQKRLRKERAEDSQASIPSSRKKTANGSQNGQQDSRVHSSTGMAMHVDSNRQSSKPVHGTEVYTAVRKKMPGLWKQWKPLRLRRTCRIQQRPSWFCTPVSATS